MLILGFAYVGMTRSQCLSTLFSYCSLVSFSRISKTSQTFCSGASIEIEDRMVDTELVVSPMSGRSNSDMSTGGCHAGLSGS